MAIDFEAEGLLEGLDGRPARRAWSCSRSWPTTACALDELRTATEEGRLALVPGRAGAGRRHAALHGRGGGRAHRAGPRVPRPAVAIAGHGARRADDEQAFTEADLEAARAREDLPRRSGMPEDGILEISRVTSRVDGRRGRHHRRRVPRHLRAAGRRRAHASRSATPRPRASSRPCSGPVLEHILGVQQRSLIRQAAVDTRALAAGGLPGRRGDDLLLRRPGGLHEPRRERRGRRARRRGRAAGGDGGGGGRAAGAADQDDRRRRDARLARHRRAARRRPAPGRGGGRRVRGLPAAARRASPTARRSGGPATGTGAR